MKSFVFLVVFSLFCLSTFASDVYDLDESNWDTYVNPNVNAFVEFYAPWCGHCKSLAPEYEIVGTALKRSASVVSVARVDCTQHQDLCSKYDVSGYPTLKWFPIGGGEPTPYSGGRTADAIIGFINSEAGTNARVPGKAPSAVVELTPENYDQYVNPSVNAFVKFFAPWCGHCKRLEPDYEKFAAAFNNENDVVIARIDCDSHQSFCGEHGISGYPTLRWYAKGSSEYETYSGERELSALVDFVNQNAGTGRLPDGMLNTEAGLVDQLNNLIQSFLSGNRQQVYEQAQEVANGLENTPEVKTYLRTFSKLIADSDYATKELARLERMLASGSLQSAKVDEFVRRVNILRQFTNA